jgi:hypothetical protein
MLFYVFYGLFDVYFKQLYVNKQNLQDSSNTRRDEFLF